MIFTPAVLNTASIILAIIFIAAALTGGILWWLGKDEDAGVLKASLIPLAMLVLCLVAI